MVVVYPDDIKESQRHARLFPPNALSFVVTGHAIDDNKYIELAKNHFIEAINSVASKMNAGK